MPDLTQLKTLFNARVKQEDRINKIVTKPDVLDYLEEMRKLNVTNGMIGDMTKVDAEEVDDTQWKPDLFSKGKKDIFKQQGIGILRSKRVMRTIIPDIFITKYPFLTNQLVEARKIKIPIGMVEKEIPADDLEDMITREVQYSYEVIATSEIKEKEGKKEKKEKKEKKKEKIEAM